MRFGSGLRLALIVAAVLAAGPGCRSAGSTRPAAPPPPPPKSEPAPVTQQEPPKPVTPPPPVVKDPAIEAQDENWRKIADEAFKQYSLQDQQKIAESNMYYTRALSWRDKGDLEKAKEDARKAVEIWRDNPEARKLLTELNQVTVGGRKDFGARTIAQDQVDEVRVKIEQAQIEITNHIRMGERHYSVREFELAVRQFEEAEFKIKSIPYDVRTMQDILPKVSDYLSKAREASRVETSRVEREKRLVAEAEVRAHEQARRREIVEKIAQLLELAYMAFDQRRFDRCAALCNEILIIDPHYFVAVELKEDAEKARHRTEYYDFLRKKIENWKSLADADSEAVIPYSQTVRFPSAEEWADISKRMTQATIKTEESGGLEEDPEVLAINRKLDQTRINIEMESAKLQDIVDYIREVTNLNIIIDPSVREKTDLEKQINFKVKDLFAKNVLKLLLSQFTLDYTITEEKVVMITTPELAGGKSFLELHDIRDILVKIQDFPGPKVELASPSGGGAALTGATFTLEEPKETAVSEDQIVDLIKENIAPGTWEGQFTVEKTPNQQLLVNHSAKTHRELREFLQKLRSYTGTMVAVTARFLAAFDDFLDDVGVDIINRPPIGNYDIPGSGITDIDDQSGETGPGFVTNESARLESYDLRAQTFHTFLLSDRTGRGIDPLAGRQRSTGGLGLQYQWIGEQALQMVLRAVHKNAKATIVQAPRITVFNTQRSHIMILNQVAYIQDLETQISTFSAAYDPVIGVLTQGVVLDVRPIVSNDRKYVTLELRPSLAELQALRAIDINSGNPNPAAGTTIVQLPWLLLQKAETTVTVPDRGTIMISGFKDIVMRDLHSGVPFFQNIPILNFFFTRKGKTDERRRLMILVTPEIIDLSEHENRNF